MPYIHGPQEDDNPIIDYIIKSYKYKKGGKKPSRGEGTCTARPDGNALAQARERRRRRPSPPPVLLPILACPLHTDACLRAILP